MIVPLGKPVYGVGIVLLLTFFFHFLYTYNRLGKLHTEHQQLLSEINTLHRIINNLKPDSIDTYSFENVCGGHIRSLMIGNNNNQQKNSRWRGIRPRYFRESILEPSFWISHHNPETDLLSSRISSGIDDEIIAEYLRKWLLFKTQITVVVIGANLGEQSLYAAAMGHKVLAFEPVWKNVEKLCESVYINGFQDRITIIPLALGFPTNETLSFNLDTNSTTVKPANMFLNTSWENFEEKRKTKICYDPTNMRHSQFLSLLNASNCSSVKHKNHPNFEEQLVQHRNLDEFFYRIRFSGMIRHQTNKGGSLKDEVVVLVNLHPGYEAFLFEQGENFFAQKYLQYLSFNLLKNSTVSFSSSASSKSPQELLRWLQEQKWKIGCKCFPDQWIETLNIDELDWSTEKFNCFAFTLVKDRNSFVGLS